jgi:hypothetical protein
MHRFGAVVSAMRELMPNSRMILLAVLPQIKLYTLPDYPGLTFWNQSNRFDGEYDQGARAVGVLRVCTA